MSGEDSPPDRRVDQEEAGAGKREHEQGHEERLRAAHNIVLRAEPYCVDIYPKICVLRTGRDVAEVQQQGAEQCRRRNDISRDVHPLVDLAPGRLVAAHLVSPLPMVNPCLVASLNPWWAASLNRCLVASVNPWWAACLSRWWAACSIPYPIRARRKTALRRSSGRQDWPHV